MVEAKLIRSI